MIQATKDDKHHVIDILATSFASNPTLLAMSRKDQSGHRIKPILDYAFNYSMRRNGVYLSDDRKSVAFLNDESASRFSFLELMDKVKLIVRTIPVNRIGTILNHLRTIRAEKKTDGPFLHFWFLGARCDSSLHSTRRFMTELFEMAKSRKKTIYAETTIPKNHRVFQRFGFDTYSIVSNATLDLKVFCMKKPCRG